MTLKDRSNEGDFCRRYSEWIHIPSCIKEVNAMSENIDENATWKEKLASSHSDPYYEGYFIKDVSCKSYGNVI